MPYIPTQPTGNGAYLNCPGENIGFITKVVDLAPGSTYDVQLEITFGFKDSEWERKLRIFGKFEKDRRGFVVEDDKDLKAVYRNIIALGVTEMEPKLDGIFLSEKGKWVLSDDAPITDIASAIEEFTRGRTYRIYLDKVNGYDKIISFCDESLFACEQKYAKVATSGYQWRIDNHGKGSDQSKDQTEDDVVYVPQ